MLKRVLPALLVAASLLSAHADVAVKSPANGASVTNPFLVTATTTACDGKPVQSMGYSFDTSPDTTILKGITSLDQQKITGPTGFHVLHVKSWVAGGASCTTSVSLKIAAPTVVPPATPITVKLPLSGAQVEPSFTLIADAAGCHGQPAKSMGYSFDTLNDTVIIPGTSINQSIKAPSTGAHTLRVKSWGPNNAACALEIPIVVIAPTPPPPTGPTIPGNALQVTLDTMNWNTTKDAGTPGTACTSSLPCSTKYPVVVDAAHQDTRSYNMAYSARAGVRWSVTAANDTGATHFIYDTWVYSDDWSQVANLEMDINQVTADGKTRILGTQCSGWDHAWDYTLNTSSGGWHWVPSNVTCDPRTWAPKTWKHIQIVGHFDSDDVSYYEGVWIDGQYSAFTNAQGATGRALGWAKGHIVINFQADGTNATTGSLSVDATRLTVIRW